MIAEFKVKNFFSIRTEQIISFNCTTDSFMEEEYCVEVKPGVKVLKMGIVYGANASGKSNLLQALGFFRYMACHVAKDRTSKISVVPFMLVDSTNMIDNNQSIRKIIQCIADNRLFDIQDVLVNASILQQENIESNMDDVLVAWIKVMDLPFSQMKGYYDYVNEKTRFATHQGVKGLQYDRVLLVIDDHEAKGFIFKYGKIFRDIPLSETDIRNKKEGKETTSQRTLRLLYITCTRAVHSLAIVLYTKDIITVKETCIQNGWFDENEITIM